jgi:uncharacterized protein with von Willebrand factor type A (vWA) domain
MGSSVSSVDRADLAVGLGRALRRAGVKAGPERTLRFARALELGGDPYWVARAVFVSSREEISAFESVFAGMADVAGAERGQRQGARGKGQGARGDAPDEAGGSGTPLVAPSAVSDASSEDDGRRSVLAAASSEERLSEKHFDALDHDELVLLRELMRRLALAPPVRRSRRARRASHGRHLDVRATLRRSHRTGGDPVRQAFRKRRLRRRRLVMLLDVSGSMESYSRAFLQFLESGVGGADAEAFVFPTRLTRLTRALRGRDPQAAIDRATAAAPDWSGGTRIGEALKTFNDRYGRRGLARGAVVVILSDGWERGEPEVVGREMERLRRLAYRIVWVNPRAAAVQFAPLAGGMAAALPHIDKLLSGHSLDALDEVVAAIATDRNEERPR